MEIGIIISNALWFASGLVWGWVIYELKAPKKEKHYIFISKNGQTEVILK